MLYMILALVLPLVGGLLAFASGNKKAPIVALAGMVPGFIVSVMLLNAAFNQRIIARWEWLPGYELGWQIDHISAILICLVYFISLLVHLFSTTYLKGDLGIGRFYAKLGFFTTSMLGLLAADHLLLLFVFWELVGFSSFLLIGFWFKDLKKAKAAREAFMINRVADAGLLIGVILMVIQFDQPFISELGGVEHSFLLSLAGFGLLIGALGKSAQFPFFGWLPKAMAGPTPVSALIHAATMVAAGVYLLIRVQPVLTPVVLTTTAVIGALTAFMAAVAAITQFDIKKVLAFSTISQLGYMVMGIGVGAAEASLFHLWTHAFFKAGLFLGAGAVIHYLHQVNHEDHSFDAQDMRLMGGLKKHLPVTFIAFLVCGLSLSGLPLFSGFLSKEGILTGTWLWAAERSTEYGWWVFAVSDLGFITALLTPVYVGRQVWMVFFGQARTKMTPVDQSEPLFNFKIPLILLSLGAIWVFHAVNPLDAHGWYFGKRLFGELETIQSSIPTYTLIFSIALAIAGLAISIISFGPKNKRTQEANLLNAPKSVVGKVSFNSWYMEQFYDGLSSGYLKIAGFIQVIDKRVIDRLVDGVGVVTVVSSKVLAIIDREIIDGLVNLVAWISSAVGGILTGLQSGKVQNQLVWLLIFLITIVIWFQF